MFRAGDYQSIISAILPAMKGSRYDVERTTRCQGQMEQTTR
jgi:hypothetical protein